MSSEIQKNDMIGLKHTPLYENCRQLHAKMVSFCGWEMPVQYSGLLAEHKIVRTHVGLFDVSHMGEITVTGSNSESFLQSVTINDVSKMHNGQAQYNAICNAAGGVLDDIIIYKKSAEKFLICVNASNIQKDFDWLKDHAGSNVSVENLSEEYGQIALQGPKSRDLLLKIMGDAHALCHLSYYHFLETTLFDVPCLIARTGYTGELGFEIYCPAERTSRIWTELLNNDKEILPCGLGARDTLRLELGYLLYGNDMDEKITALECGLKWITKFDKKNFIGKEALFIQEQAGLTKKLVGFEMLDRAIARHGYRVLHPETQAEIGVVTSGSPSPTLGKNIGLMYVKSEYSKLGSQVLIDIRGNARQAQVVKKPFYTQGTAQN